MSPKNKFYDVVVSISTEDNKGRIKKNNVKYLIDAIDTNQAEKHTMKLMEGTLDDWEILSISVSKVKEIYVEED